VSIRGLIESFRLGGEQEQPAGKSSPAGSTICGRRRSAFFLN
jgi:hypothetical protein